MLSGCIRNARMVIVKQVFHLSDLDLGESEFQLKLKLLGTSMWSKKLKYISKCLYNDISSNIGRKLSEKYFSSLITVLSLCTPYPPKRGFAISQNKKNKIKFLESFNS